MRRTTHIPEPARARARGRQGNRLHRHTYGLTDHAPTFHAALNSPLGLCAPLSVRYLEALTGLGKTRAVDKHRYDCYLTEQPRVLVICACGSWVRRRVWKKRCVRETCVLDSNGPLTGQGRKMDGFGGWTYRGRTAQRPTASTALVVGVGAGESPV